MARNKPHKKLELWGKAIEFVVLMYEITKGFPKEEEFGLKAQLRRAAVSVPSNISEGLTRRTKKEKLHFLNIAQASLSEIDAQVDISEKLTYLSSVNIGTLARLQTDVEMLLSGLIQSISKY